MTNTEHEHLAPHVHPDWREKFVLELRVEGVSGAAIGDALSEVDTHCRDSGDDAETAFGPAADYAKSLDLPSGSTWTRAELTGTWIRLILLVAGFWLALLGIIPLIAGRNADVSGGLLASFAATLVLMVLVFVLGTRLMRAVVDRPLLSLLGFGAAIAAIVAVGVPFRQVSIASLPPAALLAAGIGCLAARTAYAISDRRSGKTLNDPVTSPRGAGDDA